MTGASSGIGAATARALASAGHPVVLGARRLEVCEELAKAIAGEGGEAAALALDLEDPASVDRFAEGAAEAFGPVEVLVSNAAQIWPGTALETAPGDFEKLLRVNVIGAHQLVPGLRSGHGGAPAGRRRVRHLRRGGAPRPAMAAYVTSKWGLEGYVRALQMEWEGTGVRASVVRPGPT